MTEGGYKANTRDRIEMGLRWDTIQETKCVFVRTTSSGSTIFELVTGTLRLLNNESPDRRLDMVRERARR